MPSLSATTGVPAAAMMSVPLCLRPPLRGKPQLSMYSQSPATGKRPYAADLLSPHTRCLRRLRCRKSGLRVGQRAARDIGILPRVRDLRRECRALGEQ